MWVNRNNAIVVIVIAVLREWTKDVELVINTHTHTHSRSLTQTYWRILKHVVFTVLFSARFPFPYTTTAHPLLVPSYNFMSLQIRISIKDIVCTIMSSLYVCVCMYVIPFQFSSLVLHFCWWKMKAEGKRNCNVVSQAGAGAILARQACLWLTCCVPPQTSLPSFLVAVIRTIHILTNILRLCRI